MDIQVGIIGGSGLYDMEGLTVLYERTLETPFGAPSDSYVVGEMDGVGVAFLSRHGRGHRLLPSELNYRANIFGFKLLGAHTILSASAVGSMKEQYRPMDIIFPHQFIDRTRHRADTFFGNGIVAHVAFADPVCAAVSLLMGNAASAAGAGDAEQGASSEPLAHMGGVYLCMEGPQFSTRAESNLYRTWGVDVIGMTVLTEAKLAREAEICYATMALVTDYDCWHADHEDVSLEQILGYLRANAAMAQRILKLSITGAASRARSCACNNALQYAIITAPDAIPPKLRDDLAPLIGKYLP
jgi:5'-methylthioadenosine phosphorylase